MSYYGDSLRETANYFDRYVEDTCVDAPAIPAWVLREESRYFQRQLHNLRSSGMKVYF